MTTEEPIIRLFEPDDLEAVRRQYERLGGRYASDLTDEELALIEPFLPASKLGGRPRTTDLREVLNAIFYVLRTGCQWRTLPREFPPDSTVYDYSRRFWQLGIWARLRMALLLEACEQAGGEASPSAGIIDCCSQRTASPGDRQAAPRRRRLSTPVKTLGDRTHLRLARPQSTPRQGL